METEHYKLALMFEWGGGCLWCRNEVARATFGIGPVEEAVGLDSATLDKLHQLTEWHDTALNWDYPPDPGPWSEQEYEDFDRAACELLDWIQKRLGNRFKIEYEKLGQFEANLNHKEPITMPTRGEDRARLVSDQKLLIAMMIGLFLIGAAIFALAIWSTAKPV